jgi:glycosyltransferase involved in cell wall biosynthesis
MNNLFSGQPLTVHQFHFRASAGEAVTQQMLFLKEAFADIGIGGKIFAVERKNLTQGKVEKWSLDSAWDCDLLLVHHSQGNPSLSSIQSLEVPQALVYHSLPPETFYSHDLELKSNIVLGRRQLSIFRKTAIQAFGVSALTVMELEQAGFKNPRLLPLLNLDASVAEESLSDGNEPKNLLFVGKLAPHKHQALLIQTFYHLKPSLPDHSKLFLVGTGDPLYTKYLRLLIRQLGLSQSVILTGKVTETDLNSYYSLADAFVGLSAHEGFCIPLVEAMKFGVPVFYRPLSGAKDTMAGAGIELLSENPIEIAAVIKTFLSSQPSLKAVLKQQKKRLHTLSLVQNKLVAQKEILELCSHLRPGRTVTTESIPNHAIQPTF